MSSQPLIAGFARDAPIGVSGGRALAASQFLDAAVDLARRLPESTCGLLLCQDRLAFALGFAAMALRRSTALLPPSRAAHAIERIVRVRVPAYALVDHDDAAWGVQPIVVDPWASAPPTEGVPAIADEHVAAIVYTSGTTGDPQPHAKSWSSLARGAAGLRQRIGFHPGDAIAGAVPAQHMWGLEATVMLALQGGGIVHPGVPLLPQDIAAALAQLPSRRWLVLTPLHVHSCVRSNVTLPSLAGVLTATSVLQPDLAQRFERQTGAPTIEIYGSTETGVIGTRRPSRESSFTPLRGLSVQPHADGLLLRGAQLDGDVALRDRALVEPDGRFTLTGRDADLVKVGGKRASLAMLNHALLAIDGVVDGAFIVLDSGGPTPRLAALAVAPTLNVAHIAAALRERIDAVFLPRPLHLVEAMPRDALGKLPAEMLRRRMETLSAPHDRAAEGDGAQVREFVVPATHPALAGHFPGRPIVPAAWLLTLVGVACRDAWGPGSRLIRLDHARFRAPLAPEVPLRVRIEARAAGRIVFTCTSGSTRVADGTMTFTTDRQPPEGGNPVSLDAEDAGSPLWGRQPRR